MNGNIFDAIAGRIMEEPRLYRVTRAERQAAFRARRTALKVLERAAREHEFDGAVLEDAFRCRGIQVVTSGSEYSIIAEGDGLEIRRNILKALRAYCRMRYVKAYNAGRVSEKKMREERRTELEEMGIDLTRFRTVCDVIDRTPRRSRSDNG